MTGATLRQDAKFGIASPLEMAGLAGGPPTTTQDALFSGLLLSATSALAVVYFLRSLKYEKSKIWTSVGFAAMGGAALGFVRGASMILSTLAPEK
jgi:hypothetical protein